MTKNGPKQMLKNVFFFMYIIVVGYAAQFIYAYIILISNDYNFTASKLFWLKIWN